MGQTKGCQQLTHSGYHRRRLWPDQRHDLRGRFPESCIGRESPAHESGTSHQPASNHRSPNKAARSETTECLLRRSKASHIRDADSSVLMTRQAQVWSRQVDAAPRSTRRWANLRKAESSRSYIMSECRDRTQSKNMSKHTP